MKCLKTNKKFINLPIYVSLKFNLKIKIVFLTNIILLYCLLYEQRQLLQN